MHLLNNLTALQLPRLQGHIQTSVLPTDLPMIHNNKYILYCDPVHTCTQTCNFTK